MLRGLVVPAILVVATIATIRHAPVRVPVLDEDSLPRELPPAATNDGPGSMTELRDRIAAVLDREGVPGVGVALVDRDGPIWVGGVGVADLDTGRPVDADTAFRAASITKMIVGLGVMRLVEQGKLDLERPLRDYMPGVIDNPWRSTSPVTLGQVLEHTAGLDDMRPNEVFCDDDEMTATAALAINPRSREIRWRPGSRMAYSNVGYTLAARAIEVVTGEPFDVYLTREVLRPLGMRDAAFRRTDTLRPRLATGYDVRGRPARFRPIPHRAAGALLTSAKDLAALVQFWIRRGDGFPLIVSPAGLERIERAGTLPFPALDTSYGLGNYGDVAHPVRARGHDGGLPGFLSSLRYFPRLGRGYVMLLDATFSREAYVEIRRLLFAYLVHGQRLPASASTTGSPPPAAFYRFAGPRHELFGFLDRTLHGWSVDPTAAGVHLDPLIGPAFDLVPAAGGAYRQPFESGSSMRFARAPDGTEAMVAVFAYAEAAPAWPARLKVAALWIAMTLLSLAPFAAAAALVLAAVRRRRPRALGLWLYPAIASLALDAFLRLFNTTAIEQRLGEPCLLTFAIWASTVVFAIAATLGAFAVVRWSVRPDRPPLLHRLFPIACAVAAAGVGLWLDLHGIIGLRTWAW